MENDKIVHFSGFVTSLPFSEFTPLWESYLNKSNSQGKVVLDEIERGFKGSFQFISQHEFLLDEFNFAFMKNGVRSAFPERKARVVQMGGYTPMQQHTRHELMPDEARIIALVPFGLSCPDLIISRNKANVYEAYFENCAYNYIIEVSLQQEELTDFLTQLKEHSGIEFSLYNECFNSSLLAEVAN